MHVLLVDAETELAKLACETIARRAGIVAESSGRRSRNSRAWASSVGRVTTQKANAGTKF